MSEPPIPGPTLTSLVELAGRLYIELSRARLGAATEDDPALEAAQAASLDVLRTLEQLAAGRRARAEAGA